MKHHVRQYLVVDEENFAQAFWDACWQADNLPPAIESLLNGFNRVEVTPEQADQILAWCEQQPGWKDGPEYARHPLIFQDAA